MYHGGSIQKSETIEGDEGGNECIEKTTRKREEGEPARHKRSGRRCHSCPTESPPQPPRPFSASPPTAQPAQSPLKKRLVMMNDVNMSPEKKHSTGNILFQAYSYRQLTCPRSEGKGTVTACKWDRHVTVKCNSCGTNLCEAPPARKGKFTESNILQVYFSLVTGGGDAGLQKSTGFFSRKNFSVGDYARHSDPL